MEAQTLDIVTGMDWRTIIVIIAAVYWMFWSLKKEMKQEFKELRKDVSDLDKRVSRIEGAIYRLYNPDLKTGTHE